MASKVYKSASEALEGLTFDGMTVMARGFGLSGTAEHLIVPMPGSGVTHHTPNPAQARIKPFALGPSLRKQEGKKIKPASENARMNSGRGQTPKGFPHIKIPADNPKLDCRFNFSQ